MKRKGGEDWLPDFGDGGEAEWRRLGGRDGVSVMLALLLMTLVSFIFSPFFRDLMMICAEKPYPEICSLLYLFYFCPFELLVAFRVDALGMYFACDVCLLSSPLSSSLERCILVCVAL